MQKKERMAQHTFITGQFVRIDQQLANASQRAVSALIDILIKIIVGTIMMGIVASLGLSWDHFFSVYTLLLFSLILLYDILFEYLNAGRTLGKMMMGLRVVTADGSKPSFATAFVRAVFFFVEGYSGFGIVAMLFTKDNRRLGDLAADTYVIKDKYIYMVNSLAAKKAMFPPDYRPTFPQVINLSLQQVEVIQETYYERGALGENLRLKLSQQICKFLNINVSGFTTQRFLSQLVYDYRFMMAEE